jgi:polyhydroxybutyrate depolymerase
MRLRAAVLVAVALLGTDMAAAPARASTITEHTLPRPEGQRHYVVVEPDRLARSNRPLVILLHGHGTNGAMMVGMDSFAGYRPLDWVRLAERERVLLIAPDGMKASDGRSSWNDCRGDAPTNPTSDDVGFISDLISVAVNELGADPERVYVFGSSNGGSMAYRLGIELAPRLAAIGVQSALMPAQSHCKAPTRPMSVFVMHGTADRFVPYEGGKLGNWLMRGRGSGIGVEESVALWRRVDGLTELAGRYRIPHLQSSDPTFATRYIWGQDPARVQIELMRIEGGGHAPSSKVDDLPWILRKLAGNMNHDVDAAEEAWIFFRDKRASVRQ